MAKARVENVFMSHGLNRFEVAEGIAGDIVQLTGIADAQIEKPLPIAITRSPTNHRSRSPTLRIYLGPNTSPFKGQEGEFFYQPPDWRSSAKELETNVGLQVEADGIGYTVAGRGELHLACSLNPCAVKATNLKLVAPASGHP